MKGNGKIWFLVLFLIIFMAGCGGGTDSNTTPNTTTNTTTDTTAPTNTTGVANFINLGVTYTNTTSVTLYISATDNVGVTGYYASESPTAPSATATGWAAVTSTTNYSANVPFPLSSGDGTKTAYVWFKDAAGNVSTSVNNSITLDTTPPDTTITTQPTNPTNSTSAGFSFTSTEAGSTFECKLDWATSGIDFSSCTSPMIYTALASGSHTFDVRAWDAAGNLEPTPASYTWTIDTTAPTTTSLVGTWGVGQLRHGNDGTWLSRIVKPTFNSDGTGSRTLQENNNGTIQSSSDTFTYTWSSNSDGSLTVTMNFADGSTSTNRRVISDDGKVMIWDRTDQSDNQQLQLAIKLDTTKTYTNADLQGDYYGLGYRYKSSDGTYRGGSGIHNFDGSGSRSTSGTHNTNGTLSTFSNTKTYSVNSDGKYFIDSDPNGYLLGNGIMGIDSHVNTSDVWSIGGLLKKQDKTYSTADLEGTWAIAGFGDDQGTSFHAEFGSITCDNSGNCTSNLKIRSSDGSVSYITSTSSISVASDGSFGGSLDPGAPSYAGAIGNNGNTLIINDSFDQADLNGRFIGVAVRCSSCSNLAFSVGPITFADYLPLLSGTSTFQWTYGPNTGTQYTSTIGGTETVPYTSGSLTGIKITGLEGDPLSYGVGLNDGTNVKFLAFNDGVNEYYLSSDCSLTAPSEEWSFSIVYDGMIKKQNPYYAVNKINPADCVSDDRQWLLFDIQNVTVQGTSYQNAVIWWYLDLNYTFSTLNFNGRDSDLGITLPTSSDTGGYAVTAFEIYGLDTGLIASGDVDAASGNLNDLSERVSE